mmetsp:Transcript_21069/g.66615  ORF Transcript_21069/g.66615 Transcript_21069/m.66615 type:complete len:311 (-) Transcript_21069:131-1063(-)
MGVQDVVAGDVRVHSPVAEVRVARRLAPPRGQIGEGPGLVEGEPDLDAVPEGGEASVGEGEVLLLDLGHRLHRGVLARPPGPLGRGVQEALRQVPVVERDVGRDAQGHELVDEIVVEGLALGVDAVCGPASGEDARPGDAEAVVLQAHGLHQGQVGVHHVVVVARYIASGALARHRGVHGARRLLAAVAAVGARHAHRVRARVGVPDGGAPAALPVGALHLVGSRAQPPDESLWKLAEVLVLRRPLPPGVGRRVDAGAARYVQAALVADVRHQDRGGGRRRGRLHLGLRLGRPRGGLQGVGARQGPHQQH